MIMILPKLEFKSFRIAGTSESSVRIDVALEVGEK